MMLYKMVDEISAWLRHQMETFSAFLVLCAGIHRSPVNSPHKGQRRGTLMFSLICTLNKRFSKQSWGWWFETPSRSLWRHCNAGNIAARRGRKPSCKRFIVHSISWWSHATIYIHMLSIIYYRTSLDDILIALHTNVDVYCNYSSFLRITSI